jgi:hypothetical protein
MLYYIDFKLGDFTVCVKKKSQKEKRFKSLFNIVNRLNTSIKVSEKRKMKKLHYRKRKKKWKNIRKNIIVVVLKDL